MNALDRLLRDEIGRLLDRIGAATRPGVAAASSRQLPDLRERLDAAEERVSAARAALLAQYEEWQAALQVCEDLWAVAQIELEETVSGSLRAA